MEGNESKSTNNIQILRNARGLSLSELARDTNIGKSTLASYESRGVTPRQANAEILANYFGVSIPYLLKMSEFPLDRVDKIKFEIDKSGKSLEKISLDLNIPFETIQKYYYGIELPEGIDDWDELAMYFDVSVFYLIGHVNARTYDEDAFHQDSVHIKELLEEVDKKSRAEIVDIFDSMYLIVHSAVRYKKTESLKNIYKIIRLIWNIQNNFSMPESFEYNDWRSLTDIEILQSYIKEKTYTNSLFDELFELYNSERDKNKDILYRIRNLSSNEHELLISDLKEYIEMHEKFKK